MRLLLLTLTIMAGFSMSCSSQAEGVTNLGVQDFQTKMTETEDYILLDVRTPGECAQGTIPGAIEIDVLGGNFEAEAAELDNSKAVFVYCKSGGRSSQAAGKLSAMGFTEIYNLNGGITDWGAKGMPIE